MVDFASLSDLKAYLNITTSTYDTVLSGNLLSAKKWIQTELSRDIEQLTYTETLNGSGTPYMFLKNYPVNSITSITVGGTAKALTEVVILGRKVGLNTGQVWAKGVGNVQITYTAGYSSIPDDVKEACKIIAAWRYKESERIAQSTKSIGGNETVAYQTSAVPAGVAQLLKNLKRVI